MELAVEKRDILGKKVRTLRRAGLIPAELYGHGIKNLHLSVKRQDFEKVYREAGENTVINVLVDGKVRPTIIHDVEFNPLSGEVMSVDFREVKMDEAIKIPVPIELVGESPAIRDLDGVLVKAMDEIEVEALPGDIPPEIKVDLSSLTELGQSIYVRNLASTGKFKFTVDPDTVVVTVAEPAPEEVAPAPEVTPESVIVEAEEKKAERLDKETEAEE